MLREVIIEHYRCFRKATLRLGPLTALVGPNASGKTSLLRLIAGNGAGPRDLRSDETVTVGRIRWARDDVPPSMIEFSATSRGNGPNVEGQYLHFDLDEMREPQEVGEQWRVDAKGRNMVNVFATLPRKTQSQIAESLAELIPVLRDVTVRPKSSGKHRFVFEDRWREGFWYEPSEVSDGTMLTLGYLTVLAQERPPTVLAIEEPERGVHPFLLGELVALFRKLARGDLGQPVQVVFATQSAELLEHLEPDEVRFLNRDPKDGTVTIEAADTSTDAWRDAYDAYQQSLGNLWLSGGLGGVPSGS